MNADDFLKLLANGKNDADFEGFLKFTSDKLWNQYNDYLMDNILITENKVNAIVVNLPNASENKPYEHTVDFGDPRIVIVRAEGLVAETHGLAITVSDDKKSFKIAGTPDLNPIRNSGIDVESTFELTVFYTYEGLSLPPQKTLLERKLSLVINQDPRYLWKNIPVDWDNMPEPKYYKEDTGYAYVTVKALPDGTPQKDIVAASKRGRSHAQEGKPRDDHFELYHNDQTNWYVIAVADGAGSAKFSREGSRIACGVAVEVCKKALSNCEKFEENINLWHIDQKSEDAGKLVSTDIYNILGKAAHTAHNEIKAEAARTKNRLKDYATTLLLAICKKFDFGWFVASFWVGDGAMCLYDKEKHTSVLLGAPDEGEYGGQTRFLTMPEIFANPTDFFSRLKCRIVPDFTALFLMSDGVSDPKFETDVNLNSTEKWDALWDDLKDNGVELTDDNEAAKEQLLNWLDFWSVGNHDDRTIAILY